MSSSTTLTQTPVSEMSRDQLIQEAVSNSHSIARRPEASGRFFSKEEVTQKANSWLVKVVSMQRGILK